MVSNKIVGLVHEEDEKKEIEQFFVDKSMNLYQFLNYEFFVKYKKLLKL